MKILELHGFKYSRDCFSGYKFRLIVLFKTADGEEHKLDIYTTNTDLESIEYVLLAKKTEKVISLKIIHSATVEQDKAASEFIDEILKKI